jgi:hypothetical protein
MPVLQPRRASLFEATETSGALEVQSESVTSPALQSAASLPASVLAQPAPMAASPEAAGPPPRHRDIAMVMPPPPSPEPDHESFSDLENFLRGQTPLLTPPETSIQLPIVHLPVPEAEPRMRPVPFEAPSREALPLLVAPSYPALRSEPALTRRSEGGLSAPLARPESREDIHISIGRIEIRALPPKAAPASRRAPESRPSALDSYLQQRGSRRTP